MKGRKIYVIIILFCLSFLAQGQKDSLKVRKFLIAPSGFGYTWQGSNNFDVGLQPCILLNAKRNHNNIGITLAVNGLVYKNSTYFTPVTKLRIMIHERKNFIGWSASIGHSYTNIQNKQDHRITPEIGLNFNYGIGLTLGYNIPVTAYLDGVTNYLRVGLRFSTH